MRKILSIGKKDAYYEDRKSFIGALCRPDAKHIGGGWWSGYIRFDKKTGPYRSKRTYFYSVKLSKEI